MDKESVDFKILDEMQQGSMITVVFGDDTKVTGQVSEKILVNNAYDDEDEYYFFKIKFGGDCTLSVDSREIKGIERCITGQVSEKILVNNAYDDEDEYYFFKIKFGGDCTLSVDSREIKGIERCITRDAGLITGRVVIEKYGISCNRYMGNVITEAANKWDELNNTAKEEISKVFSSSMNWNILRDMLGTMNISKKCNKENHEKII